MGTEIKMYGDMVYGVKVNKYGLEHGRLDYGTLYKILGGPILNNHIRIATRYTEMDKWELVLGEDSREDIYQEYIISDAAFDFLKRYTDEIVYYNEELEVYLWCVTHFGTSWDYVLTDIELVRK